MIICCVGNTHTGEGEEPRNAMRARILVAPRPLGEGVGHWHIQGSL